MSGVEAINPCNEVNPNRLHCTVCTGDKSNNVFYVNGQCRLDQMTYDQVIYILQHYPKGKSDLLRITCDETLIELANDVMLFVDPLEDDQNAANRLNANTLPFYTLLMGNIDGSVLGR